MKKLLLKLLLFIIPIFIYIGTGIYIDAYNVFHVDDIRFTRVTPNENFIKTKYVLENKDKFNAFIFGSSRAANLPSENLPKETEDGTALTWYNMTYPMGGIEENYMTVKTFTDAGVPIKEIVILIDEISMWKPANTGLDNLIFTNYQTYEQNPIAFYYSYLKQKPLLDLLPEFRYKNPEKKELYYSYGSYSYGTDLGTDTDREMPPPEPSLIYDDGCQSVHYLQELKNLCDAHDIKLIVITSPILESTYREGVINGYFQFLKDVSEVTDFYCFSGLNNYTQHTRYYFDASHFKPYVGYEMEKVVFGSDEERENAQHAAFEDGISTIEFGTVVTGENVDEVIKHLQDEL